MPTEVSTILGEVRIQLRDLKSKQYWSEPELTAIFRHGALDLWGAILDLHQEHYFVVDEEHVSLKANASVLSGVPTDCFRVLLIEPRDTTTDPGNSVVFRPKDYQSGVFAYARSLGSGSTSGIYRGAEIYYHITGVGSPIEAPRILVAPQVTSDLNVRLVYCPTITVGEYNPVPGESDHALKAWTIAYARAKEREDQMPDPGWLAVYSTEKQAILTRITPRQDQEPQEVEGLFEGN